MAKSIAMKVAGIPGNQFVILRESRSNSIELVNIFPELTSVSMTTLESEKTWIDYNPDFARIPQ